MRQYIPINLVVRLRVPMQSGLAMTSCLENCLVLSGIAFFKEVAHPPVSPLQNR